ncbi:hypothetical protein M9Y10_034276 [Tritrichomonas musculus]|uniref:Bromo domain-containing protein n=1 Tax=Tritrichomonas musculus TaxID=1915356 RepID=A0ABR2KF65_9EUKA
MTMTEYDKNWCDKTLTYFMKWTLTQPFRAPVDPIRDGAERYFEIIKKPMDFGTMRKKLNENQYTDPKEFVADVHLICNNAIQFNGENSMYAFMAADISKKMDDKFKNKPNSIEEEWQKKLEDIVIRLKDHVSKAPPIRESEASA